MSIDLRRVLPKSSENTPKLAGGMNRWGGVIFGTPDAPQLAAGLFTEEVFYGFRT